MHAIAISAAADAACKSGAIALAARLLAERALERANRRDIQDNENLSPHLGSPHDPRPAVCKRGGTKAPVEARPARRRPPVHHAGLPAVRSGDDGSRDAPALQRGQRSAPEGDRAVKKVGAACIFLLTQLLLYDTVVSVDEIKQLACYACGHMWIPRSLNRPIRCPRCQNFRWDDKRASLKLKARRKKITG